MMIKSLKSNYCFIFLIFIGFALGCAAKSPLLETAIAPELVIRGQSDAQLPNDNLIITDTITTTLAGEVKLVERVLMEPILDEVIGMVESGYVSQTQADKVRRQIGAKQLIVGTMALESPAPESRLVVNARLIDLDSGLILDGWSQSWPRHYLHNQARQLGKDIRHSLTLPSPSLAMFKSTLVPGWGQLASRRKSGYLFMLGEVVALGGTVWAELAYEKAKTDYQDARMVSERERLQQEKDDKLARRNLFLMTAGGLWTINVVDAYLESYFARRGREKRLHQLLGFQVVNQAEYFTVNIRF